MKRSLFLMLLAVCLAAPAALAQVDCPTEPTGPHYFGISTWYDYGPDEECWRDEETINGDLEEITLACSGSPGWDHGYGYTSAEYEFQVADEDVLENWWVNFRIKFDDPNNSSFNWVRLKVYVTHNNVTTSDILFLHNGGSGDLTCASDFSNFSAEAGDTVRLLLETNNWYTNTVIQTSLPHIENSWP
ncbi:MAG TPA: hypothetical protein VEU30_01520 [Thermoanaerobaculia bacterium]|nr:hypothetical protein [Thermoanaerobaculia bacterium]